MSKSYKVSIKGVSHKNTDGSSRQNYIKTLQIGDKVNLFAEPMHIFDRWAVAVFTTSGKQIGYLPSDARDSSTLLKGEPIVATVKHLTGGVNWFSRFFLRKKYIGVVLLLKKENIDWQRYDKLLSIVKPIDEAIKKALETETEKMPQEAINIYKTIINDLDILNKNDKYASAHRKCVSPIDRLSLLLEKEKKYEEVKQVIEHFRNEYDPIRPNKGEQDRINKRYDRILKKLEKK